MRTAFLTTAVCLTIAAAMVAVLLSRSDPRTEASAATAAEDTDLLAMLSNLPEEGFARPEAGWTLSLPRDHGAHPWARMESWQVSAHLTDAAGDPLGMQFALLRLGVQPPDAPAPESPWDISALYRAHVTIVDPAAEQSIGEERFARALPSLAGHDPEAGELRLDNWTMTVRRDEGTSVMTLSATIRDTGAIALQMRPEKPPAAFQPGGADAPFVGYALTRLSVTGQVDLGDGPEAVSGTAWLDHTWGDLPLPGAGPVVWDRVQFQLEDGTDVSIVRTRRRDGRGAASLSGFLVAPDGTVSSLGDDSFAMTSTDTWRDEATSTTYPVGWRLEGPGIDIEIAPLAQDQLHRFRIPVWSGLVQARGTLSDSAVTGLGTLQLTGYAER